MKTSRPSGASSGDVARDVVAADHVEDEVGALAAGRLLHRLDEVLVAVVDRPVGAELVAGRALFGACRRWRRPCAEGLGELDGGGADAAGAAVDQEASRRPSGRRGRRRCSRR